MWINQHEWLLTARNTAEPWTPREEWNSPCPQEARGRGLDQVAASWVPDSPVEPSVMVSCVILCVRGMEWGVWGALVQTHRVVFLEESWWWQGLRTVEGVEAQWENRHNISWERQTIPEPSQQWGQKSGRRTAGFQEVESTSPNTQVNLGTESGGVSQMASLQGRRDS